MRSTYIVFGLVALLAFASVVRAGSEEPEGHDDDVEDYERETEIKIENDKVEIKSDQRTGTTRDYFELEVDSDGLGLLLDLKQFSGTQSRSGEGFRFRLRSLGLVEFVDANGDGKFQFDEICTYGNNTRAITPFRRDFTFANLGSVNGITSFSATYPNNLYKVTFHLANSTKTVNGISVYPTTVKFDIDIDTSSYTWRCANNQGRLALVALTRSKSSTATRDPTTGARIQNKAITFGGNAQPLGFFSWADTVDVTDQSNAVATVSVLFSGIEDVAPAFVAAGFTDGVEDGSIPKLAFYSFNAVQPKTISWDPEFGYVAGSNSASKAVVGAVALVLSAVVALFNF